MTDLLLTLIVAVYAVCGWKILKRILRRPAAPEEEPEEEPEPETNFEFLTVREQLAAANAVSDEIDAMEQLQNDLAECSPDDVLGLHLMWVGFDGTEHEYDILCNGSDTASECMAAIAARESHDLRVRLSHQCAVLARGTRSTQNCTQNDEEPEGEW